MARLKLSPKPKFVVYEDSSIPTPDSSRAHLKDCNDGHAEAHPACKITRKEHETTPLEDVSEGINPYSMIGEDTELDDENDCNNNDNEDDEDRRESNFTRQTSISSLPESSVFDTDYEADMPAMHKPYTAPSTRPAFRRPESVRRMQLMASPTPFERSSPRRLHVKSRTGTPRSVKQSPRPKPPRYHDEDEVEEEKKEYPLVLLHMTLLPVELRWSAESMLEILPPQVIENLQLLRSKVSETILNRGILVPHPKGEYELLEDRLLEALELKKERVTKCGQFRGRTSISSSSSGEESLRSADSGVGLSLRGEDAEYCTTCDGPVKAASTAVDNNGKKWSIKVFAANGLMGASAWSAAWTEMESVDIEITPWIHESLGKQLDAMAEREDERRRHEDDKAQIMAVVEKQDHFAHEERKRMSEVERMEPVQASFVPPESQPRTTQMATCRGSDLPQVYRTDDIPLSMLLRNYVYLLAQDKRNVAMFALAVLALWMSLRAAILQPQVMDLTILPSVRDHALSTPSQFVLDSISSMAATTKIPGDQNSESEQGMKACRDSVVEKSVQSNMPRIPGHEERTTSDQDEPFSNLSGNAMVPSGQPLSTSASESPQLATAEEKMHLCANHDLGSRIFTLEVSTCHGG